MPPRKSTSPLDATTTPTDTYQCIITTAETLFQDRGFANVSTRDIATICGITQPTLYYHFKDKEEIFIAVCMHKTVKYKLALAQAEECADLGKQLYQVAVVFLNNRDFDHTMMMQDLLLHLSPANQDLLRQDFIASIFSPVQRILNNGLENQEIKGETPPMLLTQFFLGLISPFLGKRNKSFASEIKTEVIAQQIVKQFLDGCRKRE